MTSTAHKKTNKPTVVILPESNERTLCICLQGNIIREDYERNFYKPLQAFVDQKIPYGLLLHYSTDYEGWHTDAAARSFESIIDHGKSARKIAYVNAPDSKVMSVKIAGPLFGGEVRFFEEEELGEALDWIRAD